MKFVKEEWAIQYGILTFNDPTPKTDRKILHVDMDAFYASIEIRDKPELAPQPVVIARHPHLTNGRGIVTTCNYVARQYGIHSAMPAIEAFRLCPHAVFIPGRMTYYREISQQIHAIFREVTDLVEPLSLDEAYLDVTENHWKEKSALIVARRIQARIQSELNLTCSIGVSYNKFIAKLASDFHKPSGITYVSAQEAVAFLHTLPIKDFYGIGEKSLQLFYDEGIYTGADLAKYNLEELIVRFGKMGCSLYHKVRGIHEVAVQPSRERKSMGREKTYVPLLNNEDQIKENITQLVIKVVAELNLKSLCCQAITLKIRYENFDTLTRQATFERPTHESTIILEAALNLWDEKGSLKQSVRLLGISLNRLLDPRIHPQNILLEL